MPNWVKNLIDCEGTSLKELYVKKDGVVEMDFNKVIPMPKELLDPRISVYPLTDEAKKIIAENEKKYGAPDWFHWGIKHWGTKWNGGEVFDRSDHHAEIDTAWSCPEPVIKAISEKFHTYVHCSYADEDLGSNCGEFSYRNGELVYRRDFTNKNGEIDHEAMFDFACRVWGLDPEEERKLMEEE